jgi:hypothetical protein
VAVGELVNERAGLVAPVPEGDQRLGLVVADRNASWLIGMRRG